MTALSLCGCAALGSTWLQWAESRLHPHGLAISLRPDFGGRGITTLRARAAGEVLASVSNTEVLTASRLLSRGGRLKSITEAAASIGSPFTETQVLVLFLLSSRSRLRDLIGPDVSHELRYVEGLPEEQPTAIHLVAERALLPRCYAAVSDAAVCHLRAQHLATCTALAAAGVEDISLSESDFAWAFSHVRARSIQIPSEEGTAAAPLAGRDAGKERALFPILDLFNHRPCARASLIRQREAKRSGRVVQWSLISNDTYGAGHAFGWVAHPTTPALIVYLMPSQSAADTSQGIRSLSTMVSATT